MPKKPIPAKKPAIAKPIQKAVSTPVRNTPIPKPTAAVAAPAATPAPKHITREQIAARAFEIFASGTGGSEADNWYRAERELRGI